MLVGDGAPELWCWGRNESGQLGIGTTAASLTPVMSASVSLWDGIEVGFGSTCVHGEDAFRQYFYCAGAPLIYLGTSGYWYTNSLSTRTYLTGFPDVVRWVSLPYGQCMIDSLGAVTCWGGWDYIGRGITSGVADPGPVALPGAAAALAGRAGRTCAIVAGEVWCWGIDDHGQLGDGAGAPDTCQLSKPCALTPQRVSGLSGMTSVFAGQWAACARDASGATWCWGDNSASTDGAGLAFPGVSAGLVEAPVRVTELDRFDTLSFSPRAGCGIDAGVLYCWGHASGLDPGDPAQIREVQPPD